MSATDEIVEIKRPLTPVPDILTKVETMVNAVATELDSKISNTLDTPLKQIEETTALLEKTSQVAIDAAVKSVESKADTIISQSQVIIDETTKLLEKTSQVAIDAAAKSVESKTDAIISEGLAIVDETTKLVEDAVQSVENIAAVISEEEKRITETITRLSITMEQHTEKAATLMDRIKNFVKLILSCTRAKDKSAEAPVSASA